MIFLYLPLLAFLLNKINATAGSFFVRSHFPSYNLIIKSADTIWSTTHVKPISREHKKLFKQSEAHLILIQKTFSVIRHKCVNLQMYPYHHAGSNRVMRFCKLRERSTASIKIMWILTRP